MIRFGAVLITIGMTFNAEAQSFSAAPVNPVTGGFNSPSFTGPVLDTDQVLINRTIANIPRTASIDLGFFASKQDLQNLQLQAGPQGPAGPAGAPGETNSAALVAIARLVQRNTDRLREGVAMAGSFNVMMPNPGDRFAISVGGAGYAGTGAGSIAASARLTEDVTAYIGYARSSNENMVKGGLGVSFK